MASCVRLDKKGPNSPGFAVARKWSRVALSMAQKSSRVSLAMAQKSSRVSLARVRMSSRVSLAIVCLKVEPGFTCHSLPESRAGFHLP